jgi:hypothetical protein
MKDGVGGHADQTLRPRGSGPYHALAGGPSADTSRTDAYMGAPLSISHASCIVTDRASMPRARSPWRGGTDPRNRALTIAKSNPSKVKAR